MRKQVVLLMCLVLFAVRAGFGQTDLIVNGGFETGSAPWAIFGQGAGIFTGPGAFAGFSYLTMGNASGDSQYAYQTVTFPTNLIAASLSFYVDVLTTDPNATVDDLLTGYITDTSQNVLATIGAASNLTPTPDGYFLVTFPLTTYSVQTNLSPYAGKTVDVYFTTTNAPFFGSETTFNLDNVSLISGTTTDIPANDNFTNSIAMSTNAVVEANTFCASKEPGEPSHAGNAGGHSIWWNWTPVTNGIATVTTAGSTFTTLLAVYTGSAVTNLTKVASQNGNGQSGGTASVRFPFSAGTKYQIAVDGYNGAWGNVALGLTYSLDTVPPTVAISSPASGADVTNSTVAVKGTASDNVAVAEVQFSLSNANGTNAYQPATGTTNWTATVTNLIAGPNTVTVQAIDSSGNLSTTASRTFNYIVTTPLSLSITGSGTVSGATNGQPLAIGEGYTLMAKAATGFKFLNWTGGTNSTNATLKFTMASNLMYTANFVDDQAPTLAITTPKAGLSVSNANYTVTGTAKDNVGVANVFWQLNGGAWTMAASSNNWTNWTANMMLTPGTNKFSAYAEDGVGNLSVTDTVSFVYILTATLTVTTNGDGTVSPNDNGALLEIGKSYTLVAKAVTGFKFVNWTGSTNSTNATLTFPMASNLMYTANFVDDEAPALAITAPKAGLSVSNANYTVTGTAKDNVAVANVFWQLNSGAWTMAATSNNWTNWSAGVSLTPGTNIVKAYANDAAGNNSATQSVSFVYVLSAVLTVNTNGRGTVSPNDNGVLLEIGKSYTLKAAPATGFKFTGWTGSTNSTNATLTFTMESNLTYNANFADATPPTVTLTSPTGSETTTNAELQLAGKAADNVAVADVFYSVSGSAWTPAQTSNNWSNWTANVALALGTNIVQIYAQDTSGLDSAVVTLTIVRSPSPAVFPIASGPGENILHPQAQIAYDGGNYLVAFQTYPVGQTNNSGDFAQFVSPTGQLVGSLVNPQMDGDPPCLAFDGSNYLMATLTFTQAGDYVEGTFIGTDGTTGVPGQISQSTTVNNFGTMIFGGGVYFLMWADGVNSATNGGFDDIYGAIVAPDGTIVASDFEIGALGDQNEAGQGSAGFDGTNFLATWGGATGKTSINGRLISPSGSFVTDPFVIYTNNSIPASKVLCSAAFNGTNYLVLFNVGVGTESASSWHILGRLVTTSGEVLTNQITLTTDTGPQIVPCAAFDGSNFLITWNQGFDPLSANSAAGTVMGRVFDANANPTGPEFPLFKPASGQTALWAPVLFDGTKFFSVGALGHEVTASPDLKFTNGVISGAFIFP